MVQDVHLLLITGAYLTLLFAIAYYAERREKTGRSLVANPYIYSLSLAVYCTSWTFYGSVGRAATSGLSFLTIYLGPTLMAMLWCVVLVKMINIARQHRITTIADFIGARYGNSLRLSALITVVATLGITPYLGLQVKAIITSFTILSGHEQGGVTAGWFITFIIGLFAVMFGVRREGVSDKHVGLVYAIAFESVVKLVAFLAVGLFVTYVLFDGYGQIVSLAMEAGYGALLSLGGEARSSYTEWASILFLSTMAIMFLPRQFHIAVVENHDVDHVRKAVWLFPLYLLLINLFVLPVALGGLLYTGQGMAPGSADFFVLSLPQKEGHYILALFVFLGGFSAASSMIIVESLAISNMVMNNIVNPLLYKYNRMKGFSIIIGNIKSLVILGLVFTGYLFAVQIGNFYSLVDMGLKSFEAVSIFAPSLLLGLYWKKGNEKGALAGIIAGFVIWCYTLMVPALMKAGVLERSGVLSSLFNSELLNPLALFGLTGLDRWSHSLFWGLLFNVGLYAGVSIFTSQSQAEERQALAFVESFTPQVQSEKGSLTEVEDVLRQYVGEPECREVVEGFLSQRGVGRDQITGEHLTMLKEEAQRVLSSVIGSSMASRVLEERLSQTEQERSQLLSTIRQMGQTLRLSRQELARANRELALLKEFSENIIESLPLGVVTLDSALKVRYWNRAMLDITGLSKDEALGGPAQWLLKCLSPQIFSPALLEGDLVCSTSTRELKGYVTRLTGSQEGYVIVLEDITEKKKIEEELVRSSRHASIGRLAAGVAHEIGNPLASISSLVQELMSEPSDSEFLHSSLDTVNHHVNRIARIVRNLGDFARIYPRQKSPLSLRDSLERTLDLVRYDKQFRSISIEAEFGEAPPVRIDPDQMQQVFLNLALNARDAMPEGGVLSVKLAREDSQVRVTFSDTGRGIPSDIREHVFDPFFSTKGPKGGTGLGLSISYGIINDHGGSIEIQPGNPEGTSFIIRLPLEGVERSL